MFAGANLSAPGCILPFPAGRVPLRGPEERSLSPKSPRQAARPSCCCTALRGDLSAAGPNPAASGKVGPRQSPWLSVNHLPAGEVGRRARLVGVARGQLPRRGWRGLSWMPGRLAAVQQETPRLKRLESRSQRWAGMALLCTEHLCARVPQNKLPGGRGAAAPQRYPASSPRREGKSAARVWTFIFRT